MAKLQGKELRFLAVPTIESFIEMISDDHPSLKQKLQDDQAFKTRLSAHMEKHSQEFHRLKICASNINSLIDSIISRYQRMSFRESTNHLSKDAAIDYVQEKIDELKSTSHDSLFSNMITGFSCATLKTRESAGHLLTFLEGHSARFVLLTHFELFDSMPKADRETFIDRLQTAKKARRLFLSGNHALLVQADTYLDEIQVNTNM